MELRSLLRVPPMQTNGTKQYRHASRVGVQCGKKIARYKNPMINPATHPVSRTLNQLSNQPFRNVQKASAISDSQRAIFLGAGSSDVCCGGREMMLGSVVSMEGGTSAFGSFSLSGFRSSSIA